MKKNLNDIFNKAKHVKVINNVFDPQVLLEYFYKMRDYRKEFDKEEVISQKEKLFDPDVPVKEKKILLVRLAGIDEVEVYRTLEKYQSEAEDELKQWASLAFQENSALLQSSLLEESYILVSSALGGKDDKIRYFAVLLSKDNKELNDLQKKIIEKETKFLLEELDGELEQIEYGNFFVNLVILVPYNKDISELLNKLVNQINELGGFMDEYFIVKNDKILSIEETEKLINDIEDKDFDPVAEMNEAALEADKEIMDELEDLMKSFDLDAFLEDDEDKDDKDDNNGKDDDDDQENNLNIDDLLDE